jgi:hypothetical protein
MNVPKSGVFRLVKTLNPEACNAPGLYEHQLGSGFGNYRIVWQAERLVKKQHLLRGLNNTRASFRRGLENDQMVILDRVEGNDR